MTNPCFPPHEHHHTADGTGWRGRGAGLHGGPHRSLTKPPSGVDESAQNRLQRGIRGRSDAKATRRRRSATSDVYESPWRRRKRISDVDCDDGRCHLRRQQPPGRVAGVQIRFGGAISPIERNGRHCGSGGERRRCGDRKCGSGANKRRRSKHRRANIDRVECDGGRRRWLFRAATTPTNNP